MWRPSRTNMQATDHPDLGDDMKKTIAVALSLGLLAGAFAMPAEAAKKKKKKPVKVERVVEWDYVCPCPGVFQLGSATGTNFGGGPLALGLGETFVKITSADMSGTPILVSINQDLDGDGGNNAVADVCAPAEDSEENEAVEVNEGLELRLFITTGSCEDGSTSVPLGGTLTVTLSNMP